MGRRKGVVDERTLKMMENYIADRESGLSISQIADKYNLDKRTVHAHLEGILRYEPAHCLRDLCRQELLLHLVLAEYEHHG